MKKYIIAVDLEGVACVVGEYGKGMLGSKDSQFACEQGTREAAAAANALFDSGADEVFVWDCHGTGVNLDYCAFDKRCKFIIGAGSRKRFPGIDQTFTGVLFIGYHAYDTSDATLAHIMSSATFQQMKINGREIGELQLDAAVAGKYGVPPLFVASDNICIKQAEESFAGIVTTETKKAIAWNSCISRHPLKVAEDIYEGVKKAVENEKNIKPYVVTPPFEYEIKYKRIEYAQGSVLRDMENKLFERPDAYTRRGMLADVEHMFEF